MGREAGVGRRTEHVSDFPTDDPGDGAFRTFRSASPRKKKNLLPKHADHCWAIMKVDLLQQ